jgi:hypothetical protein
MCVLYGRVYPRLSLLTLSLGDALVAQLLKLLHIPGVQAAPEALVY